MDNIVNNSVYIPDANINPRTGKPYSKTDKFLSNLGTNILGLPLENENIARDINLPYGWEFDGLTPTEVRNKVKQIKDGNLLNYYAQQAIQNLQARYPNDGVIYDSKGNARPNHLLVSAGDTAAILLHEISGTGLFNLRQGRIYNNYNTPQNVVAKISRSSYELAKQINNVALACGRRDITLCTAAKNRAVQLLDDLFNSLISSPGSAIFSYASYLSGLLKANEFWRYLGSKGTAEYNNTKNTVELLRSNPTMLQWLSANENDLS